MLKSAEFYAHAMISALLLYLLWNYSKTFGEEAAAIAKWFKPAASARATDAYLKEECVKNTSNTMLMQVSTEMDYLYSVSDVFTPSLKHKHNQANEESLYNSISIVKMVASNKKKPLKSTIKTTTSDQVKRPILRIHKI